jgi:hypothetical protein
MSNRSNKPQYFRDFLNKPEHCHGAMVCINVSRSSYSIKITDCEREIRLHGCHDDVSDFRNAIYKIDTLIENLQKAKNAIREWHSVDTISERFMDEIFEFFDGDEDIHEEYKVTESHIKELEEYLRGHIIPPDLYGSDDAVTSEYEEKIYALKKSLVLKLNTFLEERKVEWNATKKSKKVGKIKKTPKNRPSKSENYPDKL